MHIGLIGGIGPAATLAYYERLTDRCRDADRPLDLTIAHADVNTLAANARADRRAEQAAIYAALIDRLAAAGAEAAAITSVGGSFCEAETRARSALPLVSAFAHLDRQLAARGLRRVGLLGTETAMRTRLYGSFAQVEAVIPRDDIAGIAETYEAIAITGRCDAAQRETLFAAGRELIGGQGADAVLLAGTDLLLAFDGRDPGFPVIDAVDCHVDLLFALATDSETIETLAR